MNYAADAAQRKAILAAERAELDWLDAHPEVPVSHWGSERIFSATRHEVNALGVIIGEEPEERPDAYRVVKRFGAGVAYVAYAQSARDLVTAGQVTA